MTWTVLETIKKQQRKYYKVQCICGYVGERRADFVDSNRSTECKVCSTKRKATLYGMPSNSKGIGTFSKTHFSTIKYGALRRNISFNITQEFLWNLFLKQNKKCTLTGITLTLVPDIKNTNPNWSLITASLDRIDSSKGYVEDNVQWIHKEINRLKNNYSQDDFINMCSLVVRHVNPDLSVVNANIVTTKEQRLESEEATNNLSTSAQHPNKDEDIV